MPVEYKVRFENGSMVITQNGTTASTQSKGHPLGSGLAAHLGALYTASNGGGSNPNTDTGGGSNPNTDTGGGSNPNTDTGGGSNPNTDTGGLVAGTLKKPPVQASRFFQMETQQESEWCWAAVSVSVDHYYRPDSYSTQCEIASQVIEGDCCAQPQQFDEPERLQDALGAVGRLGSITGRLTFEQLKAEIDAGRPVCIRIEWDGGGAHFLALDGYRVLQSGARTVDVADPFYADSTNDFDAFPSQYHGGGAWTATFLTRQGEKTTC